MNNSENSIVARQNGAVELYYDNSGPKLATTATGVNLGGGTCTFNNNGKIALGVGGDLEIYHDATYSRVQDNTNHLYIKGVNITLFKGGSNEEFINCIANGKVELYYDNSLKFETTSIGAKVSHAGSALFSVESTLDSSCDAFVDIKGSRTTSTTSDISAVRFCTNDDADPSTYNGDMPMGSFACRKESSSTNKGRFYWRLNTASGSNLSDIMNLRSNGSLTLNGTLTESSDSKLKKNVVTLSDSLTKVNKLRGVEYDRISTGEKEIGVIAQEVQTVFPELVSTFDENDGTLGVKYTHLTAALIEAIKELTTEVNTLKTKVAALEAK
jgi:hypothetical protein